MSDVTRILDRVQQGDPEAAEQLLPLVYDELRKLAAAKMAQQSAGQTLQATALVHEAWLKLTGNESSTWHDRQHFFRAAAEAMRHILVDRARAKQRAKRGGGLGQVNLEDVDVATNAEPEALLLVDEAVQRLVAEHPTKTDVMNANPANEETILEQALMFAFTEARAAYLQGACGNDAQLRARVESLIDAHEAAGGFLGDKPHMATLASSAMTEGPGTVIDKYKLLEKLGEGGFGVVYMAEQREPVKRRVALKIIKIGMDTREVVARFQAERQALAMMDHPNIAKVFDAGSTGAPVAQASSPASSPGVPPGVDPAGETSLEAAGATFPNGRPYFVMELVRGIKITDYCDEKKLSTGERLDLFIKVCQAVQHAHQKGIIHRDLKPSNVLVTVNDGLAVPKIIDFGIAKATQAELTEKTAQRPRRRARCPRRHPQPARPVARSREPQPRGCGDGEKIPGRRRRAHRHRRVAERPRHDPQTRRQTCGRRNHLSRSAGHEQEIARQRAPRSGRFPE